MLFGRSQSFGNALIAMRFVKNPKIIRIKISYASWTAPILNF